jgi:hypothetical protein
MRTVIPHPLIKSEDVLDAESNLLHLSVFLDSLVKPGNDIDNSVTHYRELRSCSSGAE